MIYMIIILYLYGYLLMHVLDNILNNHETWSASEKILWELILFIGWFLIITFSLFFKEKTFPKEGP